MLAQFAITIFYTQVIVYLKSVAAPGLSWTDEHVAQGFAWAPGTVNFGVPDHDGECLIRVSTAPSTSIEQPSLWAVCVPFDAPKAPLKIGTVLGDEHDVRVPEGRYNLVFEALPGVAIDGRDYAYVLDLKFCADPRPDFAILKQGSELKTSRVLRRDADPA